MVRLFVWIFSLVAVVAVVAFAAANRDVVSISLEPAPYAMEIPIWLLALVAVGVGYVWGGVTGWASGHQARRKAREKSWEASKAKQEASRLKDHIIAIESARLTSTATPPDVA